MTPHGSEAAHIISHLKEPNGFKSRWVDHWKLILLHVELMGDTGAQISVGDIAGMQSMLVPVLLKIDVFLRSHTSVNSFKVTEGDGYDTCLWVRSHA